MGCELCGSDGALLQASHKEKGNVMVCRECWSELYEKNKMVTGTGCSSHNSTSCAACGI